MIRKLWLILLVISVALLAGCGSDGDSLSGSAAVDDTTSDDTTDDTGSGSGSGGTTTPIVTTGTGDAVFATVTVSTNQIFVTGTGMNARAGINVKVYDNSGALINDADSGVNNVRVTMRSRPYGNEYLFGLNASGTFDSTTAVDSTIDVRTSTGSASIDLIAGTLPGPVEISVEVLNDSGASFSTPLVVTLPQVIIASGPPHTIAFSWPLTDAVEKLDGGLFRRIGSVTVTDRYGNAVPDGTAVHIGLIDSTLAKDDDGATTATSANLTDASGTNDFLVDFTTSSVTRDGLVRMIQVGDRVLMPGAQYNDRSRHVAAVPTVANTLPVQSAYNTTAAGLDYLVGASLIGGYMTGINMVAGEEKTGVAVTKNGYADIFLYYPANYRTIHVGCFADNTVDTRYLPLGSADVYVVASANDNRVTAISSDACFHSILPWKLTAKPAKLNGDGTVVLTLKESGDNIPLPFEPIGYSVEITSKGDGLCSDTQFTTQSTCLSNGEVWTPNDFGISVATCSTNASGTCTATVTVAGATINSGDAAKITFSAGEAEASITVSIP